METIMTLFTKASNFTCVLSQLNPFHSCTPNFAKIHVNSVSGLRNLRSYNAVQSSQQLSTSTRYFRLHPEDGGNRFLRNIYMTTRHHNPRDCIPKYPRHVKSLSLTCLHVYFVWGLLTVTHACAFLISSMRHTVCIPHPSRFHNRSKLPRSTLCIFSIFLCWP